MVNCQSWEDDSFDLKQDRVNIIAADNGTGKSVFFKMLKITACPKIFSREEQAALIRWGAECAQIIFLFVDGDAAATRVYKNKVLYLYKRADSCEWTQYYEPPEVMLKNIGLIADTKNKFIANVVDMDQGLLLVDDSLKSNYDLMQMLIFCEDLELVRERASEERNRVFEQEKSFSYKLERINQQISACEYTDIRAAEVELETLRQVEILLYWLIDVAEQISVIGEQAGVYRDYGMLFYAVCVLEMFESFELSQIKTASPPRVSESTVALLDCLEQTAECLSFMHVKGNVVIKDEDVSILEHLEDTLQLVCSVYVGQSSRVSDQELEILEKLENIELLRIATRDIPAVEDGHVQLLESLDKIFRHVDTLTLEFESACRAQESINELMRVCKESGTVLDCPVYGKVVYDGKECIPDY